MNKCDENVFKNGKTICAVDGRSGPVEEWVQRVAKELGERGQVHGRGSRVPPQLGRLPGGSGAVVLLHGGVDTTRRETQDTTYVDRAVRLSLRNKDKVETNG